MTPCADRSRLGLLGCLAMVLAVAVMPAGLMGADVPTAEQWTPVKQALASNAPDALTQLQALVAQFPAWPSGYRELAKQQIRSQQYGLALASATRALALDGSEVEAACAQVQALTALGRYPEVWMALDSFAGKDVGGWLHYYGAKAAIQAKDLPRADRLLKEARERAVNTAPLEFFFLEARMDWERGDLEAARVALEQATESDGSSAVAWYELGRVELAEADGATSQSTQLIGQAVEHFEKAQVGLPKDPNLLYGLGYARYEQAKLLLASDEDQADADLRSADVVLSQSLDGQPDFALAHLVLGNVQVQLGQYAEAIPHLQRAQALGISDRASLFNLALAMEKTGDRAGAAAILAANPAHTPGEQIQVAMGAYHDHNYLLAAKMLEDVAPSLQGDTERQAAVYRYIGHSYRLTAEHAQLHGLSDPDREAQLDAAAGAYLTAAGLRDYNAEESYLALQTGRGADTGFPASWRYLGWRSYLSLSGWTGLIGNYGPWLSGGGGVHGAFNRHPVQTVGWGLALVLPFALFIGGFFKREREPETRVEPRSRGGSHENRRTPSDRNPGRTPLRQTPVPGAQQSKNSDRVKVRPGVTPRPTYPTPRPAQPTPHPVQPTPRPPGRVNHQKVETEEMTAPPPRVAKPHSDTESLKPSPQNDSAGAALERKPPKR